MLEGVYFDGTNVSEVLEFLGYEKPYRNDLFSITNGILKIEIKHSIAVGNFVTKYDVILKKDLHLYEEVAAPTEKQESKSELWVVRGENGLYVEKIVKSSPQTITDINSAKTYSKTHAMKLAKEYLGYRAVKVKKYVDGNLSIG